MWLPVCVARTSSVPIAWRLQPRDTLYVPSRGKAPARLRDFLDGAWASGRESMAAARPIRFFFGGGGMIVSSEYGSMQISSTQSRLGFVLSQGKSGVEHMLRTIGAESDVAPLTCGDCCNLVCALFTVESLCSTGSRPAADAGLIVGES